MSKLESGEVVLEEIPFNLSKIAEEVLIVIEQMLQNGISGSCGRKKKSHTAIYRKSGICETCDDEHPVECGEV